MHFSGYWRLLDTDYKEKVVVRILTLLEEMDWSYEAVPMMECCDILEELEPRCVTVKTVQCDGRMHMSIQANLKLYLL